ncbi:MAG: NADH-quinone oxidoreductase subunit H [Verrucomicrobia bacterium]|nr:NADH-quinone oxidoreductase subunit H [Verrucomicrobiota bacterium]
MLRDAVTGLLPDPWRWIANGLFAIVAIFAVFGLLFAFLTLAERKILGRVQNRPGPNRAPTPTFPFAKFLGKIRTYGLAQPFADGVKALTKEDIVPDGADKVLHFLAPVALLAFATLTLVVIPFGRNLVALQLDAAVLYFFAAGAATELAVFMAGWASRNKYSLLAAMRALAQLISYELPLLLSWVPVVMIAGSLSTVAIVEAQAGWKFGFIPHWHVLTPWGFAGFVIFMVAALAESNRSPFDLPEAESELIAGHLTEYSGFKYAFFFMAEYFGMCALSGMAVTLFLGGWRAPLPFLEFIPSYAWFGAKLLALILGFMWIRATFPRLRIDQLTRFSWKFLVPLALINLGNTVVWALMSGGSPALALARWPVCAAIIVVPFVWLGRAQSASYAPRTYRYAA